MIISSQGGKPMNNDFTNQPYQPQDPILFPEKKKTNYGKIFGILSLVLGIIGVCLSCCCCCCIYFFAFLLGAAAIVFAILSRKYNGKFSGLAIAGLILGILAILFFLAVFAFDLWLSALSVEEIEQIFIDIFSEENYREYFEAVIEEAGLLEPIE